MDFSEIENSVRITADDNSAGDKLWAQAEILEYARDAENEACQRADLLTDETSSFTDITINTSTGTFSISNTITEVLSAKLSLESNPLMKTSRRVLDLSFSNWPANTSTPRSIFRSATNKITVYPKPIVADTLNMAVSRIPTTPMTLTGSPEVNARWHPGLLEWILYRMYMKNDSETLNVDKALDHEANFTKIFGERKIIPL